MQKTQRNKNPDTSVCQLSLPKLRREWAKYWGMQAHARIGQAMLKKSLIFKMREARGEGLGAEQQLRLDNFITAYKRNPRFFEEGLDGLKPGVRLVKQHNGKHHSVIVQTSGFEYRNKLYGSLSEIAFVITGTRWNGWVFFGLKKRGAST